MSFILGGLAGALTAAGSVGGKAAGSLMDTALSDRSAKKADNRAEGMTFRQLVNQMATNRALYDYENLQQYNYAKQYLENSAKWTVQGYRNAGINPIIAANHGDLSTSGSTASMPSVSASMGGTSGGRSSGLSRALDVGEAMRDVSSVESSLASSELSRSSAKRTEELTPAEKDLMHANADKVRAEAEQIEANTALTRVREDNEHALGGASGHSIVGQAMAVGNKLLQGLGRGLDALKGLKDYFSTPTLNPVNHLGSHGTKHSAKDDTIQVWQDGKGFIRVPSSGVMRNSAKDTMRYLDLIQQE